MQALLLLCVSSSCSPHDWFWTPARAGADAGASPQRAAPDPRGASIPPPLERLFLDYHRVTGEELRRAAAAGAAGPGRNEGRRRAVLSAPADGAATGPSHDRGAPAPWANASAGARGTPASAGLRGARGAGEAGAGQRRRARRAGVGAGELVAGGGRSRRGGVRRQRRAGGRATGIVVTGAGLEEAVMGEPAEVIVEVSGWSQVRAANCRCSASVAHATSRVARHMPRDAVRRAPASLMLAHASLRCMRGRAPTQLGAAALWRYGCCAPGTWRATERKPGAAR